jgi:aspartate racemase
VYGLQSQGLDGRQPPLASVEEMARRYVREIRAFQPEGPYFICGLSFGGVVAYEMVRQLTAQGSEVGLAALLDTYPPESGLPEGLRQDARWRSYGERFRFHAARLLWGPDRLGYIRRKARTLSRRGGSRLWHFAYELSIRIGTPLPRALRRVGEANLAALRLYRPGSWEGRVTLFRAQTPMVGMRYDPVAAWEALAMGGVDSISVPGDHISILEEPNVEVLAERLREAMDSATHELASVRNERKAATG